MGKTFLDLESGEFGFDMGGNMLMDSDGDLMMKVGDNMAIDMDNGDLHIISNFGNDSENNN